eukprot:CAMPEP_0182420080 /NCGR_PEP_ID=MMETSP1167-20130531/4619_1 /TAXON_ID=2988 /ORGANISM="Mallomonas Sp, Strain CCMP3275" /LENGTH=428 /DNA_ID=CAMNT_0024595539 /DNA_START=149 /DNA_END=1435 /DNA_ORIENTATION=-
MNPPEIPTAERERDRVRAQLGADANDIIVGRELQSVISRMKSALPFVGLLLAKFLFQHALKLTFFIGSAVVLYRTSDGLREQIALKSLSSRRVLCGLLFVSISLLLSIFFSMSIFGDDKLWLRLVLLRKDEPNIGLLDILWFACVTDLAMRTGITAVKIAVCIWVPSSLGRLHTPEYVQYLSSLFMSVRNRILGTDDTMSSSSSSAYNMDLENGPLIGTTNEPRNRRSGPLALATALSNSQATSQILLPSDHSASADGNEVDDSSGTARPMEISLYLRKKRCCAIIDSAGTIWRSLLPVPLWLNYFMQGPGSDMFPVAYLCCKMMSASWQAKALFEMVMNFIIGKLEYGHYSTAEELAGSGNGDCSICFDKHYRPVTMPCRHVFCEHCIYEWLDRERTCPVCRAEVREEHSSSALRDGDTASSLPLLI